MAATDVFNRFILNHNLSKTPGVVYIRMKDYSVIHDRCTHPLTLFTDGKSGARTLQCETPDKADRKLLEVVRDKYNESDRPLLPTLWRTREVFSDYMKPFPEVIEYRRGIVCIRENQPLYSGYPLWNYSSNPIFTLLLRVPMLFRFFSSNTRYASCLCNLFFGECSTTKRGLLRRVG